MSQSILWDGEAKMMRRTMLLLLLFALVACASPAASPTSSPEPTATIPRREFLLLEPFTLKVGTSLALKDADLVNARHEGRWIYYSLNIVQFVRLEKYLSNYRRFSEICPPVIYQTAGHS